MAHERIKIIKGFKKNSDYFFGFGDKQDYYNLAGNYNSFSEDEYKKKIEDSALKIDKLFKIILRSSITLFQAVNIYRIVLHNDIPHHYNMPMMEILRGFSLLADYRNKKRLIKEKDNAIEAIFNQNYKEQIDIENEDTKGEEWKY